MSNILSPSKLFGSQKNFGLATPMGEITVLNDSICDQSINITFKSKKHFSVRKQCVFN